MKHRGKASSTEDRKEKDMNLTVYLGSSFGSDPVFRENTASFGTWLGREKHHLIYGGSREGLMGVLADAVLAAGGTVTGIEPEMFMAQEVQADNLTELIVTKDMTERKQEMISRGDAFIALPGGTGTLEEIAEVISRIHLGLTTAPCFFMNWDHFYDPLRKQFGEMIRQGFWKEKEYGRISFLTGTEIPADLLKSRT